MGAAALVSKGNLLPYLFVSGRAVVVGFISLSIPKIL